MINKATILNTRPIALQKATNNSFVKHGFDVIDFPCIEIVSIASGKVLDQLKNIHSNDVVIFTSQYAVRHAFKANPELTLFNDSIIIAVGSKTAQVLEQNYTGDIWIPEQQNSDGVVDLINGIRKFESIKLISAENGRDLIQQYAQQNKLKFEQINVYRRQLPTANKQSIANIEQSNLLYILATSVTTLNNLTKLLDNIGSDLLKHTVVCASSRIKKFAQQLGFKTVQNLQTADPKLMAIKLREFIVTSSK